MKIKLNYMIPYDAFVVFSHVKSFYMTVVVDTDLLDDEEDLKARIIDEIMRKYYLCITRFDERAVPRWDDIRKAALSAIHERHWQEALEKARQLTKLKKDVTDEITRRIAEAYQKAEFAKANLLTVLGGNSCKS